ncbi:transposase [Prosthecobacter fusiformis]|uniref:Transposase n=1 Tax=Prosthecobacter fusiformis TaxID=48464 RepID=A0A4R7S0Z8_9BACT|nr:transposase [Prosthecobacter fusiformis]TDU71136.1 transposase [Prosthecobacter fusiformis]
MPRASRYSPAEKAAILSSARAQMRAGAKIGDIATNLGVQSDSLRGWLRQQTLDMLYPQLERSQNPRARSSLPR